MALRFMNYLFAVQKIAAGKKNVSESEREVNLVANLAEVSPEIIQDLDLSDYMKIQDWLKDFLSISTEQR